MKTLIIDFGGMTHGCFFASNGQKNMSVTEKYAFWKFLILNQIRKFKSKFKSDEMIIACDHSSWRKKAFKFYKAARSIKRKESTIDWEMFYSELDNFIKDIKEVFVSYKIIEVNGAEADDIIAVVVNGLRSIRKEIVILSRDKDFKQLLGNNVKQFDPFTQKFVVCDNPKEYLIKHIMQGDSGDGVPNIRSDDNVFIDTEKRQKPLGPKTVTKILISGLDAYILENDLQKNWDRNRLMIELSRDMIPKDIQKTIFTEFKACENKKNSFAVVQKYLAKNKFRSLLEKTEQF